MGRTEVQGEHGAARLHIQHSSCLLQPEALCFGQIPGRLTRVLGVAMKPRFLGVPGVLGVLGLGGCLACSGMFSCLTYIHQQVFIELLFVQVLLALAQALPADDSELALPCTSFKKPP